MKKVLAVFLVFCFNLLMLIGCNEELPYNVNPEDNAPALTAETVASKPTVKMTACGYAHSLALYEDGTVWGWGNDFQGSINSGKPEQILGLSDIIYIAAGENASAAIKSDGTLWMCGSGYTSKGVMYSYNLSLDEPYLTDVKDVSIGSSFTVALKNDGTVWIWGSDNTDNVEEQKKPKKVEGLPEIKQIAASWEHAAFLDMDGNVWLIETVYILPWAPQKLTGLSDVTSITGGGHHFVILKSDGTVCTYTTEDGYNQPAKLSDVAELTDVVDIAAGAFHSVAVKKDGTVWSWGYFEEGLGDGKNIKSNTPVQVAEITNATGVASGNWHVLVTTTDGLYAWGSNYMGQLGYGVKPDNPYDTSTDRSTPVKVKFEEDIISDDSSSTDMQSKPAASSSASSNMQSKPVISSSTSSNMQSKPAESSYTTSKSVSQASSSQTPKEDYKPNTSSYYPLTNRGFVLNDLDEIRKKINLQHTDVKDFGRPDPSEYLPLYPPFLNMDKDTLFHILEKAKKFNWESYNSDVNGFERRALEISIVCENTVITYLQFGIYYDGRYYAFSEYDHMIAFISEEDFQEIKGIFDATPEWPEKYYERYGYHHYSEYPRNKTVSNG
jgi:alpha-tubulin suppressor-like RCC1 family protein